ncbi:hypothetical protein [uncultured Jatrophihabitans sp.]|uniref:hypothetical protein n=1 Tax=uncultured Jatrophihabitans sp. TaxID=1610747 RepID=UPI0035C9F269
MACWTGVSAALWGGHRASIGAWWNNENAAVAAVHRVDPVRWQTAFGAVLDRIEGRFARYEPLRHAAGLMLGMLSGWTGRTDR